MNTTFKILWFEDELSWYQMEELRIKDILNEHCLIADITREDGNDFDVSKLTGNDYDLILMDFQLADENTGDVIVATLRSNNVLTDVLFYSSEEQNMLTSIRANMPPIDGVYLSQRNYEIFTIKIKGLIDKIVRRSEDIVNLRGFVLDNTSDFELRIKEALNLCWQKLNGEQHKLIIQKTIELLDGKKGYVTRQIEDAKRSLSVFTSANNNKYLLSISDRLEIFNTALSILLAKYNMPTSEYSDNFKVYYTNKVNMYRNQLSHLSLGQKSININNKKIDVDQKLHRLLRSNISEINTALECIEEFITMKI